MTDNPYTMTRAQRAQLVERLLPLYRERFDLRNKQINAKCDLRQTAQRFCRMQLGSVI